ncbi:MAG: tryptophan 2,3-dioxygenase, partial [Leptolyngbyaceae cyanobacterium SL_7_1]|nr:tryptophan 2,3-dioxygenase [Leptolyngbyaceae cyanobacterium SL_7_1]
QITYWSYHSLEACCNAKQPLTASKDEDLFIAVHQICELAFHQMVLDLQRSLEAIALALTDSCDPILGDSQEACYFLERVLQLYNVTVTTMPILGGMRAFAEFRTTIGPTSGFQSVQFRHLEIMSGVANYWQGGTKDATGTPHVAETEFDRRYGADIVTWLEQHRHHSLAHYYECLISRATGGSRTEQINVLRQHPHAAPLLRQFQSFDEIQTRFHRAHLGLAVQQLRRVGADMGTGGTSFRQYLAKYEQELAPLFPGLKE